MKFNYKNQYYYIVLHMNIGNIDSFNEDNKAVLKHTINIFMNSLLIYMQYEKPEKQLIQEKFL